MTNDLPDALIEKVARAICKSHFMYPEEIQDLTWMTYSSMAIAALQALDISGILSDLRFYGDDSKYMLHELMLATRQIIETGDHTIETKIPEIEQDQGQRARTRLLMLTGDGE